MAGNDTTIQHHGITQPRSSHPFPEPNSLLSEVGTPAPQLRGHLFYSHALDLGLPSPEKLQTPNPPKKPQMMGPPDGVSGISSFRQSGKELAGATSREAKPEGNHL